MAGADSLGRQATLVADGVIALLAFDLRNPVIAVFPDEPRELDHATAISSDGGSSSLDTETAAEDIDTPEG